MWFLYIYVQNYFSIYIIIILHSLFQYLTIFNNKYVYIIIKVINYFKTYNKFKKNRKLKKWLKKSRLHRYWFDFEKL